MKKVLALLLALVMMFTVAACTGTDKPAETQQSQTPGDTQAPEDSQTPEELGNTDETPVAETGTPLDTSTGTHINACIASEPETLDPNMESSVDGATYALHMFEGLMKYGVTGETIGTDPDLNDTAIVLGQASGYEASTNAEGQPVYTFTLRDDIYWSDGQPVTASDFEYSWKRIVDPALAADYGYILDGIVLNAEAIQAGEIDPSELGIKALDDKTLEITLEAECPYFIELCGFAALMPLREDIIEAHGTKWTDPANCISNGAFVISEWVHDSYIRMLPNDKYYDAADIGPDSITWWLNDSATSMLSAYQSGQYDFFDELPNDRIAELQASGDAFIAPYVGTYYLYINTEEITDWRVRAAMTLCIDRDYLVTSVTQGGQVPATGFVPSGITNSEGEDWAATVGDVMFAQLAEMYPDYDLSDFTDRCALAQQLYQEAVDDGAWDPSTTVTYNFNTNESHKAVAEAIQSDLINVLGMNCTLANQDWNVYTNGLGEGNFGIARLGWIADYNDAVTYLELIVSGNSYNYGRWVSDEYTDLINQAKALTGGDERDALMAEAEAVHFSEGGFTIMPLYFYTRPYCRSSDLKGETFTAFGYFMFHYATKG